MWSADLYAALCLEVMLNLLFLLATAIFEGLTLDCVCLGCVRILACASCMCKYILEIKDDCPLIQV